MSDVYIDDIMSQPSGKWCPIHGYVDTWCAFDPDAHWTVDFNFRCYPKLYCRQKWWLRALKWLLR